MRVHFTRTALRQLDAIHAYVGQTSTDYARRVVDRITRRAAQIAEFPQSGRAVPEFASPRLREVIEGPYRIIYHIKPQQIDVIAVLHGAQQL